MKVRNLRRKNAYLGFVTLGVVFVLFISFYVDSIFRVPDINYVGGGTVNMQSLKVEKLAEFQGKSKIKQFPYNPEITPLVMTPNTLLDQTIYVFPSGFNWVCSSNFKIPTSQVLIDREACSIVGKPGFLDTLSATGNMIFSPPSETNTTDWTNSYDGIFGADIVDIKGKKYFFFIKHGEHQNNKYQGNLYQGSVFPKVKAEKCAASYVDGVYRHCWDSFASFVSFAWAPLNKDSNGSVKTDIKLNDEGPILWPSTPYRGKNQINNGTGPYAPTLFIDDASRYMYVYFINASYKDRRHCMSVARAPIDSFGKAGSWKYYFSGKFKSNTLPANFSKDRVSDFYDIPAEEASCIASDPSAEFLHFNVAKIRNTDYYLGVGEDAPKNETWRMWVRISKDLVNWSEPTVLATADKNWGAGAYHYPTFIDIYGTSTNKYIDPEGFYIIGKSATGDAADDTSGYQLNAMKIKLSSAVFPKKSREYSLISNYYKMFLGWDIPPQDPGYKWHESYLSKNGCLADIKNFMLNPDFIARSKAMSDEEYISLLYKVILKRPADNLDNGSKWWLNNLKNGNMTRDNIVDKMSENWEAKKVCETGLEANWVPAF